MEKENLENLFERLQGSFDIEEPAKGHQDRFLQKLNTSKGVVGIQKKSRSWWKPLSIAASIVVLIAIGLGTINQQTTLEEQVAEISPEVSESQFYFASLIEDQVKQLEEASSPETKQIVDDTMLQLHKLKEDYNQLEQDLVNGGNSKLILSAMITNFQTRIDLLQDVLDQIETIKNFKNYDDENYTI